MDHELSESQAIVRQTAREFFAGRYPLERMRELCGAQDGGTDTLWQEIGGLGWHSLPYPYEIGGVDGSLLETAVLLEEMGRAACASPYVHSTVAAGLALVDQFPDLGIAVARGAATVIPALTAANGERRLGNPDEHEEGSARITGEWTAVPSASMATHLLVAMDPGRLLGLVQIDGSDVASHGVRSSGCEPLYDVRLDGAEVTVVAPDTRDRLEALGAAAQALIMVGVCERALQLAVDYAKQRIQFGKPIGAFQAIQHKCANMLIETEVGRSLAYKAAWQHGGDDGFPLSAHYAKAYMSEITPRVTREAIQIHGGIGIVAGHTVQLFYRIGAGAAATYGTAHEHRAQIADRVLARRALAGVAG